MPKIALAIHRLSGARSSHTYRGRTGNLFDLSYLKLPSDSPKTSLEAYMRTMNRLEQPFRGATTLQEQISHLLGNGLGRTAEESNLTPWAPAVDIYETENELVVKADLPDVNPQDLDIRVEN